MVGEGIAYLAATTEPAGGKGAVWINEVTLIMDIQEILIWAAFAVRDLAAILALVITGTGLFVVV